jgi:hypothetical protein
MSTVILAKRHNTSEENFIQIKVFTYFKDILKHGAACCIYSRGRRGMFVDVFIIGLFILLRVISNYK